MKNVKNKLTKKWESLDKDKLKTNLKRAGVAVSIGAAGVIGYKCGARVTNLSDSLIIGKVLHDHPDIKEPFMEAFNDTVNNL